MPEPLFDRRVNYNIAYNKDSSGDEYFGYAPPGNTTSDAKWQIIKLEYTGDNWVQKWAEGNDLPEHVWGNVESLNYYLLKRKPF